MEKQGNEKHLKGLEDMIKKSTKEITSIRLWEQMDDGLVGQKRNGNSAKMGDFEKRWGVEPVLSKDEYYEHDDETKPSKKVKMVEVDVEKTIEKKPDAFGKNPEARAQNIARYISSYGASTDPPIAQRHRAVYRQWEAFRSDMTRWCGKK